MGVFLLWPVNNARLGLLGLQFDRVAHEGDGLARGVIGGGSVPVFTPAPPSAVAFSTTATLKP